MQISDFVRCCLPRPAAAVIHRPAGHHVVYHAIRHVGRRVARLAHRVTARAVSGSGLVCRVMPVALSLGSSVLLPSDARPGPHVTALSAVAGHGDRAKGASGRVGIGREQVDARPRDVADPLPLDPSVVKYALGLCPDDMHPVLPMPIAPRPVEPMPIRPMLTGPMPIGPKHIVSEPTPVPARSVAMSVQSVPEPNGLALFGAGALLLGGLTLHRSGGRLAMVWQNLRLCRG